MEITVSVNQIIDPGYRLPTGWTGVYWADPKYTECRQHIEDPSWSWSVPLSDEPAGRLLFGEVDCDACREAGE